MLMRPQYYSTTLLCQLTRSSPVHHKNARLLVVDDDLLLLPSGFHRFYTLPRRPSLSLTAAFRPHPFLFRFGTPPSLLADPAINATPATSPTSLFLPHFTPPTLFSLRPVPLPPRTRLLVLCLRDEWEEARLQKEEENFNCTSC